MMYRGCFCSILDLMAGWASAQLAFSCVFIALFTTDQNCIPGEDAVQLTEVNAKRGGINSESTQTKGN